jgi:hypothetical protein
VLSAVAVERSAPLRLLERSHFFQLVESLALSFRRVAGFHRVSPERAVEILEEVGERVAARGGRVIWVDPIFAPERVETTFGPGQDGGLAAWWKEVEALLARTPIPSLTILESEQILRGRDAAAAMQPDGFHPNEIGAAYIASSLTDLFKPVQP